MELLPPSMYEVGVGVAAAFVGVISALNGDFNGIASPTTPEFRKQDDISFTKVIAGSVIAAGITYIARNLIHQFTQ